MFNAIFPDIFKLFPGHLLNLDIFHVFHDNLLKSYLFLACVCGGLGGSLADVVHLCRCGDMLYLMNHMHSPSPTGKFGWFCFSWLFSTSYNIIHTHSIHPYTHHEWYKLHVTFFFFLNLLLFKYMTLNHDHVWTPTWSSQPASGWGTWYVRLRSAGWARRWRGGNSCKWCSSHRSMPPNSPVLTSCWPPPPHQPPHQQHPPIRQSAVFPPSTHRSPDQHPTSEDAKKTRTSQQRRQLRQNYMDDEWRYGWKYTPTMREMTQSAQEGNSEACGSTTHTVYLIYCI